MASASGRCNIYVGGYPKSGLTWLCRMLGDALNCPMGSARPEWDTASASTEGMARPGPWFVRRGHYVLTDEACDRVIPRLQRLAWRCLGESRAIFIVRDPRDVAVSSAYYWQVSLDLCLTKMATVHFVPEIDCSWNDYVRAWLDSGIAVVTSYEALSRDCVGELGRVLQAARLPFDDGRLEQAVYRQSLEQRRKWTLSQEAQEFYRGRGRGVEHWLRFLRKGIVGDWANHFNREQMRLAQKYFGELMLELGYAQLGENTWLT